MNSVVVDPALSFPTRDAMLPTTWRVVDRWDETHDTFSFILEPVEPANAIRFAPGQFNMLYAFGMGESAISISGDPTQPSGQVVHTIRRIGTVTSALADLRPGDQLGVRGPFGTAWPLDQLRGRDLVFVSGGVGLAPLRPAIYYAMAHRADYGRIVILAGARAPENVLYEAELDAWSHLDGVDCEVTVDRAGSAWKRRIGTITKLIPRARFDRANAGALVCGPEIMMRYVAKELRATGMPEESIYITMERNMKCAVALCGHCQLGPEFICKDGPVYRFERIAFWLSQREV